MKFKFPHWKHCSVRELNPLTIGLFLTACLLFGCSLVFYFLSLIPI